MFYVQPLGVLVLRSRREIEINLMSDIVGIGVPIVTCIAGLGTRAGSPDNSPPNMTPFITKSGSLREHVSPKRLVRF